MTQVRTLFTAALLPLAVLCPAAYAAGTTGSSSAFGESVQLNVAPILGSPIRITSGPLPSVSGNAPAPYSASNQVASVDVALGLLLSGSLHTGILTVNAASTLPNSTGATASATVNNTSATVAALIGLSAEVIGSSVSAGGTCGALTATGSTTLVGARLNGITLNANPAPNTVLLDAAGIKVILNEQLVTGDGMGDRGLTVNAIHVIITNAPLGLGLLTGDIIIAQSKAALHCPSSSADLVLTKFSSTSAVHVGDTLSYRVYVQNNGPDAGTGVVFTDNLPSGVQFISASPGQGSCQGTSTVTCSVGTVPVGSFVRTEILVKVVGPNVSNTASVTGNEEDPNLANNTGSTTPPFN